MYRRKRGRPKAKKKRKSSIYNPVDVLKTRKELEALKIAARKNPRDLAYIALALNTGYRCGDLLSLKVGDVVAGTTTTRVQIVRSIGRREQKTGWGNVRQLGYKPRNALHEYLLTRLPLQRDEPLFLSRQRDKDGNLKAISLDQINVILSRYAGEAGIMKRVRSHSLRKAFGYFAYKECGDIAKVQALFGHSSSEVTLRYIGVEQEDLSNLTASLEL